MDAGRATAKILFGAMYMDYRKYLVFFWYFFVAIPMQIVLNKEDILLLNHLSGVLLPNSILWRGTPWEPR